LLTRVRNACHSQDVANSAGPLLGIWATFLYGETQGKADVSLWILLLAAASILIGLALLGHHVMGTIVVVALIALGALMHQRAETLGQNITKITPSRGFSIELGTAAAIIVASLSGLPVSSTHCTVGSVAFIGLMNKAGWRAIGWKILSSVVLRHVCESVPHAS